MLILKIQFNVAFIELFYQNSKSDLSTHLDDFTPTDSFWQYQIIFNLKVFGCSNAVNLPHENDDYIVLSSYSWVCYLSKSVYH